MNTKIKKKDNCIIIYFKKFALGKIKPNPFISRFNFIIVHTFMMVAQIAIN